MLGVGRPSKCTQSKGGTRRGKLGEGGWRSTERVEEMLGAESRMKWCLKRRTNSE